MFSISNQNKIGRVSVMNKTINGYTVTLYPTSNSGGFSGTVHDTTALNLKGILKRNGGSVEMFNTSLKNLVTLGYIKNPAFEYIQSPGAVFTQAISGSVVTGIVPLRFDFGGVINLIGADEFVLEWQLNDGFWGSSVNQSSSSIEIDECDDIGEEYFTPVTKVIVIEANQQNPTYSLGDNVIAIVLANYDKATAMANIAVMNSISLNSKTLTKNDTYREVLNKNLNYYSNSTEGAMRVQNFILYQGDEELDNVSLNLNLNPSNVTAAENFILYRAFVTNDWLVTRASILRDARIAAADAKGAFNSTFASKMV